MLRIEERELQAGGLNETRLLTWIPLPQKSAPVQSWNVKEIEVPETRIVLILSSWPADGHYPSWSGDVFPSI